jgi:hypothetical protein
VENLPEHLMDIHVADCAEIRAHSRDLVCDFEKKQNKTFSLDQFVKTLPCSSSQMA